jgi:hypothetical protein
MSTKYYFSVKKKRYVLDKKPAKKMNIDEKKCKILTGQAKPVRKYTKKAKK